MILYPTPNFSFRISTIPMTRPDWGWGACAPHGYANECHDAACSVGSSATADDQYAMLKGTKWWVRFVTFKSCKKSKWLEYTLDYCVCIVFVSYTFSSLFLAYREVMATHHCSSHARYYCKSCASVFLHMVAKYIFCFHTENLNVPRKGISLAYLWVRTPELLN